MNQNPYAAPSAAAGGFGGPQWSSGKQDWDVGEVYGLAWSAFSANGAVLYFATFLGMALAYLPGSLVLFAGKVGLINIAEVGTANLLATPLSWLVTSFIQPGLIKMHLAAARGQNVEFGDLFGGGKHMLSFLGLSVLMWIGVAIGFVFFLVPGVILALGLSIAPYHLVDGNMGPIEAMKASWESTIGYKGRVFMFMLVAIPVLFAGLIACGLGVVASMSIISVGLGIIYARLSGRVGAGPSPAWSPSGPAFGFGDPGYIGGFGQPPEQQGFGQAPPPPGFGQPQGAPPVAPHPFGPRDPKSGGGFGSK